MCVGSCSLCVLKLAKEKRRKERKVTNSSLLGPAGKLVATQRPPPHEVG